MGLDAGKARRTERCTGIVFRTGSRPGANSPVVSIHAIRQFALEPNARPDDEAGRGDAARQSHRHVAGAQVHAVRANGEGHIQAVVDDEGNAERLQQCAADSGQVGGGGPLEPELDRRDPPLLCGLDDGDQITATQEGVVGHEHESERLH